MSEALKKWLTIGGAALGGALAWYWFFGQYDEPEGLLGDVTQTLDAITSLGRGSRLTRAPYDTDTGVVPGAPADLAAAAGLDQEAYSLARAIASEEGHSDTTIKLAVAWAIKNYADRHGRSITSLVTRANNPAHDGSYGTQSDIQSELADGSANPKYKHSDRYCSTALDPYEQEGQIAAGVLDGSLADITGGADQFDRPAGERDPDQVAQNRINAGAELVDVPGIDGSAIRFWRTA